jgi:hypothetical protein
MNGQDWLRSGKSEREARKKQVFQLPNELLAFWEYTTLLLSFQMTVKNNGRSP